LGKYVKRAVEDWDKVLEDMGAEEFPPFDEPEGFSSYINDQTSYPREDLIIEVNRGNYPLVWFSQFKARCGIVAEKGSKASHAFRHTIATHLAEQDLPTLWKAILIGHARKGEPEGTYTHADDSKIIYEKTVAKIDYGLDLSHLKGSRFACPIR
jgi:hypothetical protein